jgi:hypothetical protein
MLVFSSFACQLFSVAQVSPEAQITTRVSEPSRSALRTYPEKATPPATSDLSNPENSTLVSPAVESAPIETSSLHLASTLVAESLPSRSSTTPAASLQATSALDLTGTSVPASTLTLAGSLTRTANSTTSTVAAQTPETVQTTLPTSTSSTRNTLVPASTPAAISSPTSTPKPPAFYPLGIETTWIEPNLIARAESIQAYWWRYSPFSWKNIEPVNTNPAQYSWAEVDEQGLLALAHHGFNIIATVKYTPTWAQKVAGYSCGPVAKNQFSEFAQFMQALVSKYGSSPYKIKYWEIGNEVDIDPALVSPDSGFGCWGDEADPYYGGGYYAEMLKVVYPAVKAVDPSAKIVLGSLLLDCDPTNPPPGRSCKPAKFLEGILRRNGSLDGANYFDIVGFHGYAYLGDNGKILDETVPNWATRGGILLGKIDFIREVLRRYNVQKPIMSTEVSLLCSENNHAYCDSPASFFYQAQADYAAWVLVRSIAADLDASIWYTLHGDGWRRGGLLDNSQQPKPVYRVYAFIVKELTGARYSRTLSGYPGLRAYEFTSLSKRIWVLWAPDQADHKISLPTGTIRVLDKFGNIVSPVQGQLMVNSPLFIELVP